MSKLLVIVSLVLLPSIALLMVPDTIQERSAHRAEAAAEVARAHAGEQIITGPVLVVPHTETFTRAVAVAVDGGRGQAREERVSQAHAALRFPTRLDTRSQLDTQTRWRGIFPVTVYTSTHQSTRRFVWSGVERCGAAGAERQARP